MGTKTIGITEEVYDRLAAEKREDESFTDTISRLVETATSDWRRGFGRYGDEDGATFEHAVAESRTERAAGLAHSRDATLGELGFELDEDGNVVTGPDNTDEGR